MELYMADRKYTVSELSAAMLCNEQEFRQTFLAVGPPHQLRLVK
jgi:hypothetical protein